jgi:hypothetical protein
MNYTTKYWAYFALWQYFIINSWYIYEQSTMRSEYEMSFILPVRKSNKRKQTGAGRGAGVFRMNVLIIVIMCGEMMKRKRIRGRIKYTRLKW